jgi:YihY family inner membrane protein
VRDRIDKLRQRYRAVDVAMAVVDKGGQDNAGHLAAVIAYFSFFSLFPLLLVFVWVLGQVLKTYPDLQEDIVDSAISKFPVIGADIAENIGSLQGGLWPLAIGLGGALWAGTKAFEAFERAMHVVWHGPAVKTESFLKAKVRAVLMIVAFGIGLTLATAGTAIVTVVDLIPGSAKPLGFLVSLALNSALVGVMFHLATPAHDGWRRLVPGTLLSGVGLTLLYTVGASYLQRVVDGAGDTYGVFAVVIGLLTWLNLIGTLLVWSAELNCVLAGRRAGERTKLPPTMKPLATRR